MAALTLEASCPRLLVASSEHCDILKDVIGKVWAGSVACKHRDGKPTRMLNLVSEWVFFSGVWSPAKPLVYLEMNLPDSRSMWSGKNQDLNNIKKQCLLSIYQDSPLF